MKSIVLSILFTMATVLYGQVGPSPIQTLNTWRVEEVYSLGQAVIRNGVIYQSLVNSNVAYDPTGSPSQWSNVFTSGGSGSGTVQSGSGYAFPAYGLSSSTTVGPSNVTTDSTGNNLIVPGTETVGTGNHVSIGALGTPTNWNLDTTTPATALTSLGVTNALCMTPMVQTVSSSASSITFSSIPATCNNLIITFSGTNSTGSSQSVYAQLNTDTTSGHYIWNVYYGQFGVALSAANGNTGLLRIGDASSSGGANAAVSYTIPGYATVSQKMGYGLTTVLSGSSYYAEYYAGAWAGTAAAINQIILTLGSGTFSGGTVASLNGTL
jgi:hypothetical protein